jgi:hypothetical protein
MSVIDAWRATEVAPTNRPYGSAPTFAMEGLWGRLQSPADWIKGMPVIDAWVGD